MLRDDALETALEAGLVKLDSVLFYVVGHEEVATRLDGLRQARSAPQQRLAQQRPAFQVESVEGQVGGGDLVEQARAANESPPEAGVVRPARDVSGHELAIDHAARW